MAGVHVAVEEGKFAIHIAFFFYLARAIHSLNLRRIAVEVEEVVEEEEEDKRSWNCRIYDLKVFIGSLLGT